MNKLSYLLVVDGSAEALAAAEFAWQLAQTTGARLVAQHVLDTPAVWGLLGYRLPGFVGSGPYFEAQKKITEVLRSVAESVMLAYTSEAEGKNIPVESYIDEGDTATEICKRATEYDLLIIGENSEYSSTRQNSIADRLVDECKVPVVMVNCNTLPCYGKRIVIANRQAEEPVIKQVWDYCIKESIPVEFLEKEAVLS